MQTKREQMKKFLTILNKDLERKHYTSRKLKFDEYVELKDKEKRFVDAMIALLDFDSSVIEADIADISAQILFGMKYSHEKINRLNSIIHTIQITIQTAESNNQLNAGFEIGSLTSSLSQSQEPQRKEYTVKEFAKLVCLHEHTVRKRFHSGELKGRQDSKGISIAASELSKFNLESSEHE